MEAGGWEFRGYAQGVSLGLRVNLLAVSGERRDEQENGSGLGLRVVSNGMKE